VTGPEHYRWAERLLDEPRDAYPDALAWAVVQGQAQVHATLALVAATIDAAEVDSFADGGLQHVASPSEVRNWREVTS
jgi:hypothetical protein